MPRSSISGAHGPASPPVRARSFLKFYDPEEKSGDARVAVASRGMLGNDGCTPLPPAAEPATEAQRVRQERLQWTLPDFFDNWFESIALTKKQRVKRTIDGYKTMLRYWRKITGNPTIEELGFSGDAICDDFVNELPCWATAGAFVFLGTT